MPKLRPEAAPIKMRCGDEVLLGDPNAAPAKLTARANKSTGKIQFFCPYLRNSETCGLLPDEKPCRIIHSFRASGALEKVELQLLYKLRPGKS